MIHRSKSQTKNLSFLQEADRKPPCSLYTLYPLREANVQLRLLRALLPVGGEGVYSHTAAPCSAHTKGGRKPCIPYPACETPTIILSSKGIQISLINNCFARRVNLKRKKYAKCIQLQRNILFYIFFWTRTKIRTLEECCSNRLN